MVTQKKNTWSHLQDQGQGSPKKLNPTGTACIFPRFPYHQRTFTKESQSFQLSQGNDSLLNTIKCLF